MRYLRRQNAFLALSPIATVLTASGGYAQITQERLTSLMARKRPAHRFAERRIVPARRRQARARTKYRFRRRHWPVGGANSARAALRPFAFCRVISTASVHMERHLDDLTVMAAVGRWIDSSSVAAMGAQKAIARKVVSKPQQDDGSSAGRIFSAPAVDFPDLGRTIPCFVAKGILAVTILTDGCF